MNITLRVVNGDPFKPLFSTFFVPVIQCFCSIIQRLAGAVLEGASQNEVPWIFSESV